MAEKIKKCLQGHQFQILRTSIAGQEEYGQLCLGIEFGLLDCSWKGVMIERRVWIKLALRNQEMGFC